jgi:electron transfer flavoprotein beta subunit
MKIIVCIKQVPARDSLLRVDASSQWVQESELSYEINEPDAYALEAALQFKEKVGGEVVALCAGPEGATQTIREALAKGADRAIHIESDEASRLDTLNIARLLAKAVESEKPELVLTGLQSDDLGFGQTGVVMAELLGMTHATIIMHVEPKDGGIRVKRELESGWYQYMDMPLPAVITIQSGISKLRYATLMGIKKSKSKEIKKLAPSDLGGIGTPAVQVEKVYLPQKSKQTTLLDGSPREAAAKLVEKLKFEVRVI